VVKVKVDNIKHIHFINVQYHNNNDSSIEITFPSTAAAVRLYLKVVGFAKTKESNLVGKRRKNKRHRTITSAIY